jgi:hypothetical protein
MCNQLALSIAYAFTELHIFRKSLTIIIIIIIIIIY